jgi:hypothetical protein
MENLWKSLPAYLDAARSFDNFKVEILTLYTSLSGDCILHPRPRYPHCYVFLTYHCARNGLPLGPSSLLRHTSPSRTDYDSLLLIVTHY